MKTLSVIIPCYNEVSTIQEIIRRVRAAPIRLDLQIIVIDDFSTDGTREILRGNFGSQVDAVHFQPFNIGKGAAIREGLLLATGDILS